MDLNGQTSLSTKIQKYESILEELNLCEQKLDQLECHYLQYYSEGNYYIHEISSLGNEDPRRTVMVPAHCKLFSLSSLRS